MNPTIESTFTRIAALEKQAATAMEKPNPNQTHLHFLGSAIYELHLDILEMQTGLPPLPDGELWIITEKPGSFYCDTHHNLDTLTDAFFLRPQGAANSISGLLDADRLPILFQTREMAQKAVEGHWQDIQDDECARDWGDTPMEEAFCVCRPTPREKRNIQRLVLRSLAGTAYLFVKNPNLVPEGFRDRPAKGMWKVVTTLDGNSGSGAPGAPIIKDVPHWSWRSTSHPSCDDGFPFPAKFASDLPDSHTRFLAFA